MMDELDRIVTALDSRRAERLGALSRSDARARIASRKPTWRIVGLLSTDDYGVLAGPKAVGKTFAMLDMAVAVGLGESWFGRFATERARVLVLTSEDSEARLWRRLDAIATAQGRDPAELEGWVFVHPVAFSAVTDLGRLSAEVAAVQPGLALLDPAYRYLSGTRMQLAEMGAVLTPLQEACSAHGAPLMVGHHYNRRSGAEREERISGAGILEWARLVITAEAPPRRDESDVVVTFEVTGNALDPVTFTVRRHVEALDDSPDPEIRYSAEVLAEGAKAREVRFLKAADRVLAVLPSSPEEALLVREIGDLVAHDESGKGGLKHDTIRQALNRDLSDRVDRIGAHPDVRWWST